MNRVLQVDPGQATGKTKELFGVVEGKFHKVPNAIRVMGNSSAALEGYLGLSGALSKGVLPQKLREQLALNIGEINGCNYCLSAHTLSGRAAGLSNEDLIAARRSTAIDPKSDAALKLARSITLQHGQIADADLQAARGAGLSDAEIVEIVFNVALNTMTNYLNNVAETVVDFPKVTAGNLNS